MNIHIYILYVNVPTLQKKGERKKQQRKKKLIKYN